MNLSDAYDHANALFLPDTVTYNTVSIPAYVHGQEISSTKAVCMIDVSKDDVSDPTYRDTVVINSVTWKVFKSSQEGEPKIKSVGNFWIIPLYKGEHPKSWI